MYIQKKKGLERVPTILPIVGMKGKFLPEFCTLQNFATPTLVELEFCLFVCLFSWMFLLYKLVFRAKFYSEHVQIEKEI